MRIHARAIAILLGTLSTAPAEPTATQPAATQPAARQPAADARSEFIRYVPDGRGGGQLQVAVATYANDRGQRVDLVSAVHVGEPLYYWLLSARLRWYDAVLYELIGDDGEVPLEGAPDTIQGLIARGLDLQFQDIDVDRPHFVHADLSREAIAHLRGAREAGFGVAFADRVRQEVTLTWAQRAQQNAAAMDLVTAVLVPPKERARLLRRAGAVIMVLQERPLAGRYFRAGGEVIIGARNAKAIDGLRTQLATGRRKLAILYGAGHMPDLERRLVRDEGFQLQSIQWLTAWTVDPNPEPTNAPAATTLQSR